MPLTCLQRSEFEQAILRFIKQSSVFDNPWTCITAPIVNQRYLARTTQITSQAPRSVGPDLFVDDLVEEIDPATSHQQQQSLIITLQHHIVYSPTYKVPVLYFDAYFIDGARLTLDELYTHVVPAVYHPDLLLQDHGSIQGVITQADHPLLGRPYWYVHPCETGSLLKTMGPDAENVVKQWLSWVGPLVRCHVPPELFL